MEDVGLFDLTPARALPNNADEVFGRGLECSTGGADASGEGREGEGSVDRPPMRERREATGWSSFSVVVGGVGSRDELVE